MKKESGLTAGRQLTSTDRDGAGPEVTGLDRVARVAVFSDAIPGRNGVGTYYDDLVEHLQPRVHSMVMVAPRAEATRPRWSLPMPGDSTQRLSLPPRGVWREMKVMSPDLVVVATPGPFGALGVAVAKWRGAELCVCQHTQLDQLAGLYWETARGRVLRRALRSWDKVMFGRARTVVVYNDTLCDEARARGARRVHLMGTPIAKAFLSRPLEPLGHSISTVTFMGRLAPEKQLEQVLESARLFPAIRFRIAGDGPLRERVEQWAREEANIESLGWVGRDDVIQVLDSASTLVLPSRFETFGTVALEAMARRRLAIVSPECGISRWPDVAEGLVVMERGEMLADALRRVCDMSSEERYERARSGRAVAERLTQQALAQWLDLIEDAVCEQVGT